MDMTDLQSSMDCPAYTLTCYFIKLTKIDQFLCEGAAVIQVGHQSQRLFYM